MITARLRRPALVVAVLALAGTLAMGIAFAHTRTGTGFDTSVDLWTFRNVPWRLSRFMANFGDGQISGAVALVATVAALVWRRYRAAALLALGPIVSIVLVEYVLKPLFSRTYCVITPTWQLCGSPSYPSGHTTGACSVAFAIAVVLLGPASPLRRALSVAASAVVLVLAAACCVGLVGALYHYVTDVIGAVLLCAAVTLALAVALTPGSGSPRGPGTPGGTASTAGTAPRPSHPSRPSPR